MKKALFISLGAASLLVSPAIALFVGLVFSLTLGQVYASASSKISSKLLKAAVVGLGFGMNLVESLKSSSEGMIFTIFSVSIVMVVGSIVARWMKIERKAGYLISAGTAICGGSAIAAIAPVIKAKANDTSISLAVIFTLNAVAMVVFPTIGEMLGLSQGEFGMWSAIAIHDTSAVVCAAQAYGEEALQIATTVKLSRALWIIPLSFVSLALFKKENGGEGGKISIPWFILLFVVAMVINTYLPINETLSVVIKDVSHRALSLTLFLIGSMLSVERVKSAGFKPILLGISLWFTISTISLAVITLL